MVQYFKRMYAETELYVSARKLGSRNTSSDRTVKKFPFAHLPCLKSGALAYTWSGKVSKGGISSRCDPMCPVKCLYRPQKLSPKVLSSRKRSEVTSLSSDLLLGLVLISSNHPLGRRPAYNCGSC
jgi:hypothetical protein